MTTRKIAITVPETLLRRARTRAKKQQVASLSAYISSAISDKLLNDDLDALLEELLFDTGGPLTEAEIARADRLLGVATHPKRSKRRAA